MEIAQLCEELQDCDISENVPSNNVADSVQPSCARSESEASITENGKNLIIFDIVQNLKWNEMKWTRSFTFHCIICSQILGWHSFKKECAPSEGANSFG